MNIFNYKMNNYLLIGVFFALVVATIIGYGTFRCTRENYVDPLTKSLLPAPFDGFTDGWAFLHFSCFCLITYLFPQHYIIIWVLGVAWEIVEFMFKDHPFYFSDCKYTLTTDKEGGWWYGRYEDIIVNTLGMYLGYYLSKNK
jgi:hypothetical protein